jgi:hypothetical protein
MAAELVAINNQVLLYERAITMESIARCKTFNLKPIVSVACVVKGKTLAML